MFDMLTAEHYDTPIGFYERQGFQHVGVHRLNSNEIAGIRGRAKPEAAVGGRVPFAREHRVIDDRACPDRGDSPALVDRASQMI